jgi:hypothetical protein
MGRGAVGGRVDAHRPQAQIAAGPDDADGDLSPVRDENGGGARARLRLPRLPAVRLDGG